VEYSGEPPTFCGYCGSRLSLAPTVNLDAEAATLAPHTGTAQPAEVPEQVGGYRLLRPLGEGGMGRVYEAEDVATGRRVALKLIASDFAGSPETVERFRQEGRLASGIAHSRCVFVLAADEEAGRPYIIMELMPGDTLESLVQKQGPLSPEEAVAKILDVIDGLREAHRLGVVHRDVKPSNCFLEKDGRVKVGDFGLAKSLVNQAHLTRTGTFLGTLLYCSPEQVRGERVDAQSDVYSVAATLYFLLAGKAPFQTGDAAATLARIVADPPPPLRGLRKEISAALDQVVLRGLERDRQRRWRSLDDFRAALLPFAPGRLSIVGVGLRFGAYLLDSLILMPLGLIQGGLVLTQGPALTAFVWRATSVGLLLSVFLYYALSEGLWGCTLGKRWLRLRVWTVGGNDPPGLGRAALRTGIWLLLFGLPGHLGYFLTDPTDYVKGQGTYALVSCFQMSGFVIGILLLLSTMRARNGYRCLHDVLSGTRVVQLPEPERRWSLPSRRLDHDLTAPTGLPERLGGHVVRGILGSAEPGRLLLAEDPGLGRQVVIWQRPVAEPPLEAVRRESGRPARLRWLAAGQQDDSQWDVFLAPAGCPLEEVVARRGPLPWAEVRPLLEQLTEELDRACSDGTLPAMLTLSQVWVRGDGQLLLLDTPLGTSVGETAGPDLSPSERARTLLQQVAVLTLEGKPRPAHAPASPVRVPVPGHAARLLGRLLGCPPPAAEVKQVAKELAATWGLPREVSRPRRAAHLAVQAAFLAMGLSFMTVGGCMSSFLPSTMFLAMDRFLPVVQEDLEQGVYREFVVASLSPVPPARLAALVQLDADLRLEQALQQHQQQGAAEHADRLAAMSLPMRLYMKAIEQQADSQLKANFQSMREQRRQEWPLGYLQYFRTPARNLSAEPIAGEPFLRGLTRVSTVLVLFWPVLWVLWAFALRGGLSFRILSLALVRGDGRPAARWQCAWRALLVWTPLVALLLSSLWLDYAYWSAWHTGGAPAWMLRVSFLAWWATWPLLAAYVVLALWHPARALHDRLAGTYLVPR
jgi:hypothetical protein